METITSRQNPLIKELRAIRDDPGSTYMFLEGPRVVEELLHANQPIEILVWTGAAETNPVMQAIQRKAKRLCQVSNSVFKAVSGVESPQGILAIAKRPVWNWENIVGRPPGPILILDGVQDPGNIAAILRTAEAAGASGLVTTPGTARLFSPKALRGAMGGALRLPVLEHQTLKNISAALKKARYWLVGTAAGHGSSSFSYTDMDWTQSCAIVLGHEGQGMAKTWSGHLTTWVHIPMHAPVESLNVAAAAAILLYESLRQRSQA